MSNALWNSPQAVVDMVDRWLLSMELTQALSLAVDREYDLAFSQEQARKAARRVRWVWYLPIQQVSR